MSPTELTPDAVALRGRVAVVTGAAQGIGAAVARAFARFGADLALIDRNGDELATVADEVRGVGAEVLTGVFDVRDPEAVEGFFAEVDDRFGRLDILVNNAGGTFYGWFLEGKPKGDEALVRENLLSAAWCTRAAAPLMREGGSVINVTSIEARRAAPGFAVYAAAKAGLEELTRTLALELADRGIRVNVLAPDVIVTPGVGPLEGATSPMGRVGQPDEVAGAALFLATPLSSFVTGAVVPVDGGNLAAAGWHRRGEAWVTPPADGGSA